MNNETHSELKMNYIITPGSITVNYNGETHTILKSDSGYDDVVLAIKEGRKDDVPGLVSKAKRIEAFSDGVFQVRDGIVFIDNMEVPGELSNRILQFESEGLPYQPLVAFFKNLNQNPSYRAVQMLFGFLEKNNHPITEDGCFIAYKKVREDFKDCHSNTFDNSPGTTVSMPRNQVNEDPNVTCSSGLHIASWHYATNFYGAGRMLEVKVNPRDAIAVPIDHDQGKMRVCQYEVLGEVANPVEKSLVSSKGSAGSMYDYSKDDYEYNDSYCDNCDSDDHNEEDCDEDEDY